MNTCVDNTEVSVFYPRASVSNTRASVPYTGVGVYNTEESVFYPRTSVSDTRVSVHDTGAGVSDTGMLLLLLLYSRYRSFKVLEP